MERRTAKLLGKRLSRRRRPRRLLESVAGVYVLVEAKKTVAKLKAEQRQREAS